MPALFAAVGVITASGSALAQDAPVQDSPGVHQHAHEAGVEPVQWTWTADANVFAGYNYQQRRFADFTKWESQNWGMVEADRPFAGGRLRLLGMFSLERFTVGPQGSPQLFQTGESYLQTPLVNYQHPHDLLTGLGATYSHGRGRTTFIVGADLVGSPALGPVAFMHRESARDNPQVPLTHHFMDSTHIAAGVVRAGVQRGRLTVEGSLFRGAEPNENRLDIERPRLDSWAARVRFEQGPWRAQVSGGRLQQPEWFEPYDQSRVTASLSFDGSVGSHAVHATLAWGGNREFNGFNGDHDGYLAEWDIGAGRRSSVFGRAEVADKELFGLGLHPRGFSHRHVFYKIGALTTGYVWDVRAERWGRVGIGADFTLYRMPADLFQYWEASRSYHVFVRWRPAGQAAHVH